MIFDCLSLFRDREARAATWEVSPNHLMRPSRYASSMRPLEPAPSTIGIVVQSARRPHRKRNFESLNVNFSRKEIDFQGACVRFFR
jgi:hypothetical protein